MNYWFGQWNIDLLQRGRNSTNSSSASYFQKIFRYFSLSIFYWCWPLKGLEIRRSNINGKNWTSLNCLSQVASSFIPVTDVACAYFTRNITYQIHPMFPHSKFVKCYTYALRDAIVMALNLRKFRFFSVKISMDSSKWYDRAWFLSFHICHISEIVWKFRIVLFVSISIPWTIFFLNVSDFKTFFLESLQKHSRYGRVCINFSPNVFPFISFLEFISHFSFWKHIIQCILCIVSFS